MITELLCYLQSTGKRIVFRPTQAKMLGIRNELQAMTESLSKPVPFEIVKDA